ncbi:LOW QUALITY PROTEIN: protocadherin-16 [Tachyglossus aculeatus]|uniref:LOW QUALITY PROTEIN: protocadherin-16 n=1 Tax=Tachyglossus aculeatus TaxID=9261 RepID=UPI0018F5D0C0|nr:LOW QUALITY PROTEIN: protocadherin-16 [Tachyglossus aculeatus]
MAGTKVRAAPTPARQLTVGRPGAPTVPRRPPLPLLLLLLLPLPGPGGLAEAGVTPGRLDLQIDEEQPAGTLIGDISAGLPPGTTAHMYFISAQEGSGVSSDLAIDEHSGAVRTARVLDRERRDHYAFIAVTPEGVTVEVSVRVNDINDHAPAFPQARATLEVPEHSPPGRRFPLEPARDLDGGRLGTQGYGLTGEGAGDAFRLDTRRSPDGQLCPELVVSGPLDRENRSHYTLVLEAFDGGAPPRRAQAVLDVALLDINDHAPAFNQSRYQAVVSESLAPGSPVLRVFAADADEGENGAVLYEINRRQSDADGFFAIDPRTGLIRLQRGLDFEQRRVHELVVQARDGGLHPEVGTAFVSVHVRDSNDNQPTMTIIFLSEDGSPRVSEGAQPGQYVARISVSDPDYGEYAHVNVSLEGGEGQFALTTKDSVIYLICVARRLDREERDSYALRVTATDAGSPPLRAESAFVLRVTDVNDNPPAFDRPLYRPDPLPEVVYPGSFVLQVTARDRDQGPNGEVTYSLLPSPDTHAHWFSIDPASGIITTAAPLDYELDPQPRLTVLATDGGRPALSSTAVVSVALQDVNDNEPVFQRNFYNASLPESTPGGTCFLQVTATDADSGPFGSLSYSLGAGIGSTVPLQFHIDPQSGEICTAQSLDRDGGAPSFDFTVNAVDGGGLNSMVYVKVFVTDENDNRPAFYPWEYAASLSAQSRPGTPVLRVSAHDPDEGPHGRVTYRIIAGNSPPLFSLDQDTGLLSVSWPLSGQAGSLLQLEIAAQDGGGLQAEPNARVNVSVVPGTASPPIFEQAQYFFTVPEDVALGTSIGLIRAHNPPGRTDPISLSISSGDPDGCFSLDGATGLLRTGRALDREAGPVLELEVRAGSGSPPVFARARVRVALTDVNDNAPAFPVPTDAVVLPAGAAPGTPVYTLRAADPDAGAHGRVTFALLAGGAGQFSVEPATGLVRLLGPLDAAGPRAFELVLEARDGGVPPLSSRFLLRVGVRDAEDARAPRFDTPTYRVELPEGTGPGTRFLQVRARGPEGTGSGLAYHLQADGAAAGFGLDPDSGWLWVRGALDREARDLYTLTVLAVTPGPGSGSARPRLTGTATVWVGVTDQNDHSPRLGQEPAFLAVPENRPPGTSVGKVTAVDRDAGPNGRLTYRLLQPDDNFLIHPQTGEVTTKRSLDREGHSSHQLVVRVQDGGAPPRSTTGTVHITVLDDNDNAPSFLHAPGFPLQVAEGIPAGTLVTSLQARDPDEGENGTILYGLTGPSSALFSLHPHSGELRTAGLLSRADREHHVLTVTARDQGSPPLSTVLHLHLQVVPRSHRPPPPRDATPAELTLMATEGLRPGSLLGSVALPGVPPGALTYTLDAAGDPEGTFALDATTGQLFLARALDFEAGPARLALTVRADDAGAGAGLPQGPRLLRVEVRVEDENEHAPAFGRDPLTLALAENPAPGATLYTFQATDADGPGPNSDVRYRLLRQVPAAPALRLDPRTGALSAPRGLDREATPALLLLVEACDRPLNASLRRASRVSARVFVVDQNDNAPAFASPARARLPEDQPPGPVALHVVAHDPDLGEAARLSYRLAGGDGRGHFHLHPDTGALSVVRPLDREQKAEHALTVVASDHGSPARSATQLLTVSVSDVNDEAPAFQRPSYQASVAENRPAGTPVLTLLATDPDLGANGHVIYGGVASDSFSLDPDTGVLTTTRPLDREEQEEFSLTAYARDEGNPPLLSHVAVRVTVTDENDHSPAFGMDRLTLDVPEGQSPLTLTTLRAADPDAGPNGRLRYSILEGDPSGDFVLDAGSGELGTARELDREATASYELRVEARDGGLPPRRAELQVAVSVLDVNDHAPAFPTVAYNVEVPEDLPVGGLLLTVRAVDHDAGDNGRVAYYLDGGAAGAFQLEPASGELRTARPLDRERRDAFAFQVTAVDGAAGRPRSAVVSIKVTVLDVNDHVPFFPASPLRLRPPHRLASAGSRPLATLTAEDRDAGANASILYRLARPPPGAAVDSYTGEIRLARPTASLAPRERVLFVVATDLGRPALSATGVVVVQLPDEPDGGPRFPRASSEASLPENAAPGTPVLSPKAVHSGGSSGPITYSILSGNEKEIFAIQPSSGAISVRAARELDFETTPRLRLVIQAESGGAFGFTVLTLSLQDTNDNAPHFLSPHYVAFLPESRAFDGPLLQVEAEDVDQGPGGQVTYSLAPSQPTGELFQMDPSTGAITTSAILDREVWAETRLVVMATDRGSPPLVGSATLTVMVLDVNDNRPTIPRPWELRVSEDAPLGAEIARVTGNDVDSGPTLSYTLSPSGEAGPFSVGLFGGRISLTGALDHEHLDCYHLHLLASDGQHEGIANLTVWVEDVNDNMPIFSHGLYQVALPEHTPPGSAILTVSATDHDSGDNGLITYHLASAPEGFSVDPSNGTVYTTGPATAAAGGTGTVDVVLEARDQGSPARKARATVLVQLQDENDQAPRFAQPHYQVSVAEDLPTGATLLSLEATDADPTRPNAALDYTIVSGNRGQAFGLERRLSGGAQALGCLVLLEPLDFEAVAQYNLTVSASDRGRPQRSAAVGVSVTVLDVNDNPPVFSRAHYQAAVPEDTPAGAELLRVAASDPDAGPHGVVRFSLSSGDPARLFQLDEVTGALRLARPLDREAQARHTLVVQAADPPGAHFALAPVTVEVQDVNDHRPAFPLPVLTASLAENQPAGTLVATLRALDGDAGPFGRLRYTLLLPPEPGAAGGGLGGLGGPAGPGGPEPFALNSSSGELRARGPLDYERVRSFRLLVGATDAGNLSASATVSVLVTGEDEYDPVFLAPAFHFAVPEGARRGHSLGHVLATDEDAGADGLVLYALAAPSPYFRVNRTTGALTLQVDSRPPGGGGRGRARPEGPRELHLDVVARGPLPGARSASVPVTVDVTHTGLGLAPDLNLLLVGAVAASLGVVVVLALAALVLGLVRARRRGRKARREAAPGTAGPSTAPTTPGGDAPLGRAPSGSLQKLGLLPPVPTPPSAPGEHLYHQTLPGYGGGGPAAGGPTGGPGGGSAGPYPRGGSLDPSHSSGRGSAEAAEDDEIRMINEFPRVASVSSSLAARGPDSGIQQDVDGLSDTSCEPPAEPWFKGRVAGAKAGVLLLPSPPAGPGAPLCPRPDGPGAPGPGAPGPGAFLGGCGPVPADYGFPADGKPCVAGALTAIVAGDEELRGSYNWDYLLSWCPQFQPLANVFTEIARLKDEAARPCPPPRIDPPPLITAVAHPGAKSVPPKPAALPAVGPGPRRSPISHEGSLSSAAMSPSFSPSLSPLAARSPVVSPFGVSQGPPASALSTDHSLETPEEGELRI